MDYLDLGRYKNGLDRCNKLLKKSPLDVRLLYYKTSFLVGLGHSQEAAVILDQLATRNPPITDLGLLKNLDELATSLILDAYPRPLSNGPRAAKLWANATSAAGKNAVKDITHHRFVAAVIEQRWQDAGTVCQSFTPCEKPANVMNRLWSP